MQKGLDLLIDKYSVDATVEIKSLDKAIINGKEIPLLPWESERRFIELRNLVVQKRVGNMCTYRIGHTAKKGTDIMDILKRECGILEFTIDSKIKEIFAISGKSSLNAIAETENGCVATIEIACTLGENDSTVDKHEIITDNGIACDMVVDTQTPKSSIYVYGQSNMAFTDTDSELYGYTQAEICAIRNAFAASKCECTQKHNIEANEGLEKVIEAACNSLKTLENVKVG